MFDFIFDNITGFLFAFIPALFSLGLVAYIQLSLPRNRLVASFAALTFCCALWQLSDSIARISGNVLMASFWEGILSIGWIFIGAVCLHFAMLYSRLFTGDIPPLLLAALYFPAFIFLGLYQSHIFVHDFQYSSFWGWVNYHNKSHIDMVILSWISILIAAACAILLAHAYRVRHDKLLSAQALLIGIGLLIPSAAGLLTQVIFPLLLNKPSVPATSYFLTFLSLATLVSLNKYKLFTIYDLLSSEKLLDELPVGVVSISDTGHITYLNRTAAALFAVDRQAVQTRRFSKIIHYAHQPDEQRFADACDEALTGDTVVQLEVCVLVGGKTIHLAVAASPIVNNKKVRGVLFCLRDITALKKSIDQTLQSELSLKEAQALSHIGSWEWDRVTGIIKWSDELYRIYELPMHGSVTYERVVNMTHAEDAASFKGKIMGVVNDGAAVDFNYRIVLPKGTIKHLNTKLRATKGEASGDSRLFGTVQDITRQVTTEYTLQQKNQQLKQSNANLEEFVFVASHDLKEPIRKIITFSELIHTTDGKVLSEKSRSYFERLTNAAIRMQTMIDDLLSLSIISQNDLFQSYNLEDLVHEAMQDLDLKIRESNALVLCASLPTVQINPRQFRQLFMNLIANSLKFARRDTAPVISISCRELSSTEAATLSLLKDQHYLRIDCADNGIGFENAYADKIFQMFQRLHGKVDYEGTGIGLALCKKVVENHHGRIIADGRPGEGATFSVIIPVVPHAQRVESGLATV